MGHTIEVWKEKRFIRRANSPPKESIIINIDKEAQDFHDNHCVRFRSHRNQKHRDVHVRFPNVLHIAEIIKQNYLGVPRILLDSFRVV